VSTCSGCRYKIKGIPLASGCKVGGDVPKDANCYESPKHSRFIDKIKEYLRETFTVETAVQSVLFWVGCCIIGFIIGYYII